MQISFNFDSPKLIFKYFHLKFSRNVKIVETFSNLSSIKSLKSTNEKIKNYVEYIENDVKTSIEFHFQIYIYFSF